jgi:hypothetical protein
LAVFDTIYPKPTQLFLDTDPVTKLEISKYVSPICFKIPENRKRIGINIRPWFGTDNIVSSLSNALNGYLEKEPDTCVVPIPFDLSTDPKVLRDLISRIPRQFVFDYEYKKLQTPEDVISIMSQLDVFLGARLHSIIVARLLKISTISISYDQKTDTFSRLLNIPSISIQDLGANDLIGRIESIKDTTIETTRFLEFEYRTPRFFRDFVEGIRLSTFGSTTVYNPTTYESELHVKTRHIQGLIRELVEIREKLGRLESETQNSTMWKLRNYMKRVLLRKGSKQ